MSLGPSEFTVFMGVTLNTWYKWGLVASFTFINTSVNDFVSDAIGPWILNTITDHKTRFIPYSKPVCLLITQMCVSGFGRKLKSTNQNTCSSDELYCCDCLPIPYLFKIASGLSFGTSFQTELYFIIIGFFPSNSSDATFKSDFSNLRSLGFYS